MYLATAPILAHRHRHSNNNAMKHLHNPRFAGRLAPLAILAPMLGAMAPMAHAQPDVNNGPKADNPANRPPRKRPNLADMTPEQRLKERLRRQLIALGANDVATQDTITTYVVGEFTAKQPLMEKGRQLQTSMRTNALSNAQVAALLNDYQAAVEEDRARHLKAQADLQKVVDFSKIPKVEALLTLLGIYGDGPTIMGGMLGFGATPRLAPGAGKATPPNAVPPAQATPPAADKI